MWMTLILKSKYTYMVIIIIGVVIYYNIRITGLTISLNNKVYEYNELQSDFNDVTAKNYKIQNDLTKSILVNHQNRNILDQNSKDITSLKRNQTMVVESKDRDIKILTDTVYRLKHLPKPDYNKTVIVKDCRLHIKSIGDINDTKSTIYNINRIGF